MNLRQIIHASVVLALIIAPPATAQNTPAQNTALIQAQNWTCTNGCISGLTAQGLFNAINNTFGLYARNGTNSDITSLNGLTVPLSAAQGGTGNNTGAADNLTVATLALRVVLGLDANNGGRQILADDGSVQFEVVPYLTAVNHMSVEGMISGTGPVIFADGTDANIDWNAAAKGLGQITLGNGLGVLTQITAPSGAMTVAWPQLQATGPSGTYSYPMATYTVASTSYTNVGVQIVPLGSYGVAAGGAHNQIIASRSFGCGDYNYDVGFASFVCGTGNQSSAPYSGVLGNYGTDNGATKLVYSSGVMNTATAGTTKTSTYSYQCEEVAAASCSLVANFGSNVAASVVNSIRLDANKTIASRIIVTARDTTTGATASWFITAMWQVGATAGTATLVGSSGTGAPTFSTGTGASSWTVALTLNTGGSIAFAYPTVTGAAGNNTIRWHAAFTNSEDQNG